MYIICDTKSISIEVDRVPVSQNWQHMRHVDIFLQIKGREWPGQVHQSQALCHSADDMCGLTSSGLNIQYPRFIQMLEHLNK